MLAQRLILIVTIALSLFSTLALAGIQHWRFRNWNKYHNDDAGWRTEWGLPRSGGWSWPRGNGKNHAIVKDPAGDDYVLRVRYPAGSSNPGGKIQGGIGFYAQPVELPRTAKLVVFQYKVYFPSNFTFVKGGKLPGLYGGHTACSGGSNSNSCFSTRFMWRTDGAGEIYAYLPEAEQRESLCQESDVICNPKYGYSLGRGSWTFARGKWVTVRQTVRLNTPGVRNGMVRVDVNHRHAYTERRLAFVSNETGKLLGIAFHTFFGGNGDDWAPSSEQHSYFKDFHMFAYY
ncbi:hypothetical protein O0I10_008212 [Lichtheimia ornata]|uniref:Polysaccharide lyase 14 domain-containing protein n=1 Tax=Lichtheimia ornata TaxID=688661 RepID=A0AAD7UYY6_9FUNG|nr:uncharacterized protein O0I10_008212 [Lichtheimia ornata]KAJ8656199.1 hypothetical protein O0I10_008212 [Lichtheimia ornata]